MLLVNVGKICPLQVTAEEKTDTKLIEAMAVKSAFEHYFLYFFVL